MHRSRSLRHRLTRFGLGLLAGSLLLTGAARAETSPAKPWPIKVVIVTTFEIGADSGDRPGEFQPWVEHEGLDQVVDFPGGVHPLRTNASHDVLGVVTGMTLANAGTSLMALGLDPRFDLSHAYWIINGIAGVDPNRASIGSVAWARFAIGDVSRLVAGEEQPAGWPYGFFAMDTTAPDTLPAVAHVSNCYPLNAALTDWAYQLTRQVKLPDTPAMAQIRAAWQGYPQAQRAPFVLIGDSFASDYFWHGKTLNGFAEDWVRLWTGGKGQFVMTEMEDSAMMEALRRLDRMGRVDLDRVMIERAASNYSMPTPGSTVTQSLSGSHWDPMVFQSAWTAGRVVLHELLARWPRYAEQPPGGPAQAIETAYCRYRPTPSAH